MSTTEVRELARAAVLEVAGDLQLGEFVSAKPTDGGWLVEFASTHPGYIGWQWCCALSGNPLGVDEVWMEPGVGALVARPWQPWSDRVQPGDLVAGDVIETAADDPRLMPGYQDIPESELVENLSPEQWSIGLGRERVLSPLGIDDAVDRWREGEHGPRTATARYADENCSTCGWMLTIGGRLGQAFGVCANPLSPSDGRIVAMDHGCGAHSQQVVESEPTAVAELVLDDDDFERIDRDELLLPTDADVAAELELAETEEAEINHAE